MRSSNTYWGRNMHLCPKCPRVLTSEKELQVHLKYYHTAPASPLALEPCPDCGGGVSYQEGCKLCTQCGWSKCG